METTRRLLFESDALQIGFFAVRDASRQLSEVERQHRNLVVLPLSGVFAKHDAPNHQVLGTPSHAVFFAADTPYRLSYPDANGDRAIILRFGDMLAPDELEGRGDAALHSSGLLSADALVLRSQLCARLKDNAADALEMETRGLDLLRMSLGAMRERGVDSATEARRGRAVARVMEAVAAAPAKRWSIDKLARIAGQSPYHLCRVFRDQTGASVYDYVLRERLALTLESVLDGADLTTVAHEAGFASHSHFTARFRAFFGATPAELRRRFRTREAIDLRKIMTAPRSTAGIH